MTHNRQYADFNVSFCEEIERFRSVGEVCGRKHGESSLVLGSTGQANSQGFYPPSAGLIKELREKNDGIDLISNNTFGSQINETEYIQHALLSRALCHTSQPPTVSKYTGNEKSIR